MHILVGLVGLLLAVGYWWYRIQHARKAGKEMTTALSTTAKRLRADHQAHLGSVAPMLQVDDTVTIAATLILSIVCEGKDVPQRVEYRLEEALSEVAGPDQIETGMREAKRLQRKTTRVMDVIQILGATLSERLTVAERLRFVDMVQNVFSASPHRPAHTANRIVALREALGLTEAQP
ncbi:hypothetical protein [Tianweitania sp.]|uniref:hypothetical protein n=1 Tax=Tianweitania sp. TaxID=2021634 RepID=UPI00289B4244|nr:hypothetical protein [Tianweitania sp.]